MSPHPDTPARTPPGGLLDLDDDALAEIVGGPSYRVEQVRRWLYGRAVASVDAMTDLPLGLRARLAEVGVSPLTEVARRSADDGATLKWLFESGGSSFETVLLRYPDRTTVCVSSQAGCAQGCPFCATGQGGFERQLSTGEILAQVLVTRRELAGLDDGISPERVSNVVFMGMGEPLANYANVAAAIQRLCGAVGLSARHVTVSTIGIPDRIRQMATDLPPVTLAVSLHAPDDELRDRLVPPNRRWPIGDVLAAVADYRTAGGRRVTFEYTLMEGVNDSAPQARALAALLRPLRPVHVNAIPMNPTADPAFRPSSPSACRTFVEVLAAEGVNATLRRNRGTSIEAACGQLLAGRAPLTLRRPNQESGAA
ncbi:MAG: 23S rRNA (adenine(2503)-C(2))-methyltransferase RlmN [Acidimicrobiia bacterium]